MIFRKVSILTTLLLTVLFGCEHTKSVLQPVDTIVPLSPDINQSLIHYWQVTTIDGKSITEGLSQLQTLIAEHVSDEINISFCDTGTATLFRFNADGTWRFLVTYEVFCDHHSELDPNVDFGSIENYPRVEIHFSVGGNYVTGYDTEKQMKVLIFETDKHTAVGIYHKNPDRDPPLSCISEEPCYQPNISPLDWHIFEVDPLSKLFLSPLFDIQSDSPVVYTWDMVTSEGTPEDYYRERVWEGYSILPEDALLISWTIRLYSHGQEDISLRRTIDLNTLPIALWPSVDRLLH